jgi:Flp pilus assembly protein TadG
MTAAHAAKFAACFRTDQRGGVLVLVALLFPILTGLSAVAIDYASLVKRRAELQRAADSGSIAGVNQFKLANADDAPAIRTAKAMALAQARSGSAAPPAVTAEVLNNHSGVRLTLSEQVALSFGKLLNIPHHQRQCPHAPGDHLSAPRPPDHRFQEAGRRPVGLHGDHRPDDQPL